MTRLLSVGALVAICVMAAPAFAHVVEVTTSIELQDTSDPTRLQGAVKSAVDNILDKTIAFTPTVVTVTSARVVGERIYLRLLIVDAEGEAALRDISGAEEDDRGTREEPSGELVI